MVDVPVLYPKWQPRLTPLAAFGLTIAMILAAVYHLQRGEMANIGINAILFVLTSFVMCGRIRLARLNQERTALGSGPG